MIRMKNLIGQIPETGRREGFDFGDQGFEAIVVIEIEQALAHAQGVVFLVLG